ncbi:hypothetical protein ACYOEI_26460 [Singulisphaera rosea]
MDEDKVHLSQIETCWTMVFQAHEGETDSASVAQRLMMERYGGAVHRYLLSVTHDPELAADVAQRYVLESSRHWLTG